VLGDPGSGKTTLLEQLAGTEEPLLVRNVLPRPASALSGRFLILDALDEARVAGADDAAPLLAGKLEEADKPRFVLSCREHDWLGRTDLRAFTDVYGDDNLRVCVIQPLSRQDALAIVDDHHRGDAEAFVEEAEKRGLGAFLENPNDLLLLIDAVRSGWPTSRRELFEQAVRILASETNEFRLKKGIDVPDDVVIEIASRLSAGMILSGSEGVIEVPSKSDEALAAKLVSGFSPDQVHEVLGRRLFRKHPEGLIYRPAHRTVAEFLGGRLVAAQSSDPRKRRRWLSAIAPGGRFPPTALRGMYAWAASYMASDHAEQWFSLDPLGVVLNGDASNFTDEGLRRLLRALASATERDPYQRVYTFGGRPWAVFAKPSLDADVAALLRNSGTPDALVRGLLLGLEHSNASMPTSLAACDAILRSGGRSIDLKCEVVETYFHLGGTAANAFALFDDLQAGRGADPAGRIRIAILQHVPYPDMDFNRVGGVVAAVEHGARSSYALRLNPLAKRFRAEDLPEVLDATLRELGVDDDADRPFEGQYEAGAFLRKLLSRIIKLVPCELTPRRLCTLHDVIGDGRSRWLEGSESEELLRLAYGSTEARMLIFTERVLPGDVDQMWQRYADAFKWSGLLRMTPAFASELVDQAMADSNMRRRAAILDVVALEFPFCVPGSLEVFDKAFEAMSRSKWAPFKAALKRLTVRKLPDRRHSVTRKKREAEDKASRAWLIRHMADSEAGVRSWTAWNALKWLGVCYYGDARGIAGGKERFEAFEQMFGAEVAARMAEALIEGEALGSHPSVAELADLSARARHYSADAAAMAALELRFAGASADDIDNHLATLSPDRRASLAVLAVDSTESHCDPYTKADVPEHGWVGRLAMRHPGDFASGVLVFYRTRLENGADHLSGLYFIVREAPCEETARQILPALIEAFPDAPAGVLTELVAGTVRLLPLAQALSLVRAALATPGLSAEATARWTSAGFLLDSDAFGPALYAVLQPTGDKNADRMRLVTVISTLTGRDHPKDRGHSLTSSQCALLAEAIAGIRSVIPKRRRGAPDDDDDGDDDDGGYRHNAVEEFLERCITVVAGDPSQDASDVLERLEGLDDLANKRQFVRHHRTRQLRARIDAEHRPPTPEEAMRLVQDVFPIGPADLKIITANVVEDLAKRYRDGDASGYRKFWSLIEGSGRMDSVSALRDVKPEDDCRDVLLEDLRPELAKCGVKIDAAVGRVNGTEVDLVSSYAEFAVPVEIKMDDDVRLWATPRDQLAPYAAEPRAGGQGVYVVFWTGRGRGRSVPPPPVGVARPTDASSMREALVAAMPEELRGDIEIVVIDVSKPVVAKKPVAKAKKAAAKKAAKAKKSPAKAARGTRAVLARKRAPTSKRGRS